MRGKGITIFLELADRLPHVQFAAVPTWGATAEDMDNLRRRPNIALFQPFDNIDDLLRMTQGDARAIRLGGGAVSYRPGVDVAWCSGGIAPTWVDCMRRTSASITACP